MNDSAPKALHEASPTSVLIVEDEVLIRWMTANDLRSAGYVVIEAGNANEALSILQSGTPIDLVVTDIRMPGSIDGIKLGILIRSLWPLMKIVILSSHSSKWFDTALSDAYIEKPYDREHLLACIGDLVKKEP